MNKPYFSVIVPVYNVRNYIDKCIDSILEQTYSNFELILVDDGSTDGSSEICDKRAIDDKRIIVIHKPNGGPTSARKAGAKTARGDHIVCVDGDDWAGKDFLKEANAIIAQYDPDCVQFGYYEERKGYYEPVIFGKSRCYNKERITREIYPCLVYPNKGKRIPPTIFAKVYKKEMYLEHQLSVDDAVSMGEDGAFTALYTASCNSLYVSDKCVYYYRYNPNSLTKLKRPLSWENSKLIDELLRRKLAKFNYDFKPQISARLLHAVFVAGATQFYRAEPFLKIRREIKEKFSEPYIRKALDETLLSDKQSRLCYFVVKHKLILLLSLYSKFRKKFKK